MPRLSGYSKTPLARKLTLKDGFRVFWLNMPEHVEALIAEAGLDLTSVSILETMDAAHLFITETAILEELLRQLRGTMAQNGMIWVSWPKKASKMPTDITEDVIRHLCLPMGLVDIKVCAVDETWSGLKLVIRKELRT
jgi:hypothetical protein